MSVIFGIRGAHQAHLSETSLRRLASVTAQYGPDGTSTLCVGRIGMGFQAFNTSARLLRGTQPVTDIFGNVASLDGRLDNFGDLASQLEVAAEDVTDSTLIVRAFARWGADCFSHFIGEWACALWAAREQTLYLARDHAGTRTLFFRRTDDQVSWSTYLETFFVDAPVPDIDPEYVGRSIVLQELRDLTPYQGIKTILPAHYIAFTDQRTVAKQYWSAFGRSRLAYKTDKDYDDHFLYLFEQSVRRRLDKGSEIVAELSGGLDSSSIVCMADQITSRSSDTQKPIGTVSYYDDTEPNWNERPYFTIVENVRGIRGIHLDTSDGQSFAPLVLPDLLYPYPGADSGSLERSSRFANAIAERGYRVILSGIGGDELLGGVPTPLPELADYIARGRLLKFLARGTRWCLSVRQPLLYMLRDTVLFTHALYTAAREDSNESPPWLSERSRDAALQGLPGYESRTARLASLPSVVSNGNTWWMLNRTLPNKCPHLTGCYEHRFPYLDRNLVEFLHRVPREQLVGPGRRRLLMRRALKGIVPTELLERKRKAFISRAPLSNLRDYQKLIEDLFSGSELAKGGFIYEETFKDELRNALAGQVTWISHLHQTISLELWLRSLFAYTLRRTA